MKKRLTFNHLLHKDKLMMVVSLILAIALWAWADYEQGNLHEIVVDNVPVQVELSSYATNEGYKIVDAADVTVTVRVRGTRSSLRGIKAQDIRVVADASGVVNSGAHKAALTVSTTKKCEILDVQGDRVRDDKVLGKYIGVTCKLFVEEVFTITSEQVDISNLTLSDNALMRFGKCEVVDAQQVTVYGVFEDVERIKKVCAVVPAAKELSKTEHFTAKLVAYDAEGDVVDTVTFDDPSDGEVGVIVPVIVYRQEELSVVDMTNVPAGLKDKLVVDPATIVLGEHSEKKVLDAYLEDLREALKVDLGHWLAEPNTPITQTVATLKDKDDTVQKDGVYLDRAPNQITITLNVSGYTNQTKEIALKAGEGGNVTILCDDGFAADIKDESVRVTLCGPKEELDAMDASNIRITIDARGQAVGPHTVSVNPETVSENTWVYYGVGDTAVVYEVDYVLVKVEPAAVE